MWRRIREWTGASKRPERERGNSHYSLVSTLEPTEETISWWLGLPEEVKSDPMWVHFRQIYEKRQVSQDLNSISSERKPSILPQVNSAPVISGNLRLFPDKPKEKEIIEEAQENGKEDTVVNTPTTKPTETKRTKASQARYYTKITILLGIWIFFTAVFLMYGEKKELTMNTAIGPGELKNHTLDHKEDDLSILIKLSGPFLPEQTNLTSSQLELKERVLVWLERWTVSENESGPIVTQASSPWQIYLQDGNLDFNGGERRSSVLKLESAPSSDSVYAIRMNSSTSQIIPLTMTYMINPLDLATGVVYAVILMMGLYILIVFEVINRTMAAIVLSTLSLAALSLAGERPSVPEIISWLDVETLLLLFSMMILVAIVAETGIFDFLSVFAVKVTKGKLWPLIFLLCGITGIVSTFLDNVTTVLLMAPVTIRLCEVMDLDPVPILMFMAIYSNIGGTATPVGDPPCVIVASNKAVIEAGINFTNFTAHMAVGIFFVFIQTTLQLRYMYRDTNKLRLNVPREIQDIKNQIAIWRRSADALPQFSHDGNVIRERFERKISKLTLQLQQKIAECKKRACPKQTYKATIIELKDKYKIRDKVLLLKASVAIVFVVIMFFLHSVVYHISLGWTALLGAILLLILADREDLEPILHRVEWSTLLFFAALFVLMEALSKLGLILYIGGLMEQLILKVDESYRLAVALMLILWVSGVISAFVDNIPLTTMMVRVVVSIGSNPNLNLPMGPLIWSLLFGACLGGNGTLIAASANVVCAGVAEQHGYKFTFARFFSVGFPIMVGHLVVSSVYLLVCHCLFTWH